MAIIEPRKTGIIIQARTGSTRLPGKMLMEFYDGRTLLEIVLTRIKKFHSDAQIVLATTVNGTDDALCAMAERQGVKCFRGSEENVLGRFIAAAQAFGIEKVVRVCADNPFIDKSFLDALILEAGEADYCSFFLDGSTPAIRTHFGFFSEYIKLDTLLRVQKMTSDTLYLEHVTNFIYSNPGQFIINKLPVPDFILENRHIRLTIDTKEDFELCKTIYAYFCDKGTDVSAREVVAYIRNRKDYLESMQRQIERNGK